ncbi:MAG TPA: M50 family metallopeptidase [Baekduia sp.]|uniref:M50 family metallopeptidase n=1 Tax=Baekduia sp. TaxID=2600305 RepID=UPI002CE0CA66|nr:M50 family metallopeptidase [Baekduia sp.]HMJ36020.1 M50 family metallopeptidase [Baekduia sp.]
MSWILAFVGFAALIILHEFGHFAAAKAVGMRVERFALFFPPLLFTVKRGETEYGIGAVPLGGYVKITGMNPAEEIPPEHAHRAYYRQPVWKRLVVIGAGPAMNVLVAFLILFVLFAAKGEPVSTSKVAEVQKNAAATGVLRPGDQLIAVDGVRGDPTVLRDAIGKHTCASGAKVDKCVAAAPAKVTIQRAGRTETLQISPRYDKTLGRMLLGFSFDGKYQPLPVGESASRSATGMWTVTKATVDAVTRLFYDSSARKNLSGVVGSYETTRQSFAADNVERGLTILALISLSLAIVNLFPFLPLDGGHIFWALAEKVRRRPIPFRVMEQASYVGFVLVVLLFAVGLTNDIGRLQDGGFGMK